MLVKPSAIEIEFGEYTPSFWKNVGVTGIFLYIFALSIATAHIYIAYQVTHDFSNIQEMENAWVFFAFLAAMNILLVLFHLKAWKKIAKEESKITTKGQKRNTAANHDSTKHNIMCVQKVKVMLKKALVLKANLDINGKWFLLKMYASEVVESTTQMYNLVTLYTCTLPPEYVLAVCAFLCIDHIYRVHSVWKPNSITGRDLHYTVDLLVDVACMALPLLFISVSFNIPMNPHEILFVVGWPSISTLLKVDDLLEENVRRRTFISVLERQYALSKGRKKSSVFEKHPLACRVEQQDEQIGIKLKWIITVITALSSIFFIAVGAMTVAVQIRCNPLLWEACVVKVPFCKLTVACNCAVLYMDKHNVTNLPEMIQEMTELRSATITRGPLKELPSLRDLQKLARLNASENSLTEIRDLPLNLQSLELERNLLSNIDTVKYVPQLFEILVFEAVNSF